MKAQRSALALSLLTMMAIAALPACGAGTLDDESSDGEQADELRKRKRKPAKRPPSACLPLGEACGTSSQDANGTCCDPAARCFEYTVYDYPRCRKPYPAGEYCYRHDQCSSRQCATGECVP